MIAPLDSFSDKTRRDSDSQQVKFYRIHFDVVFTHGHPPQSWIRIERIEQIHGGLRRVNRIENALDLMTAIGSEVTILAETKS